MIPTDTVVSGRAVATAGQEDEDGSEEEEEEEEESESEEEFEYEESTIGATESESEVEENLLGSLGEDPLPKRKKSNPRKRARRSYKMKVRRVRDKRRSADVLLEGFYLNERQKTAASSACMHTSRSVWVPLLPPSLACHPSLRMLTPIVSPRCVCWLLAGPCFALVVTICR